MYLLNWKPYGYPQTKWHFFMAEMKNHSKACQQDFADGELDRESNTQKMRVAGVTQPVAFYNLDVIISVGYRVNSKQGIAFRKWANSILKEYIIQGYAVNANRMNQLGEVIRIMKRTENSLDAKQVLSVIENTVLLWTYWMIMITRQ